MPGLTTQFNTPPRAFNHRTQALNIVLASKEKCRAWLQTPRDHTQSPASPVAEINAIAPEHPTTRVFKRSSLLTKSEMVVPRIHAHKREAGQVAPRNANETGLKENRAEKDQIAAETLAQEHQKKRKRDEEAEDEAAQWLLGDHQPPQRFNLQTGRVLAEGAKLRKTAVGTIMEHVAASDYDSETDVGPTMQRIAANNYGSDQTVSSDSNDDKESVVDSLTLEAQIQAAFDQESGSEKCTESSASDSSGGRSDLNMRIEAAIERDCLFVEPSAISVLETWCEDVLKHLPESSTNAIRDFVSCR